MATTRPASRAGDEQQVATSSRALDDGVIDDLDRAFRRLRRSLVRPAMVEQPIPCLGRPLELAKVLALDALHELAATGEQVSVKDVAATLDLEHSTVSRLLGELDTEGLLVRGVDPDDRRRATLALTETGKQVVADAGRMRRLIARTVLADWNERDVTTLASLLGRLADSAAERLASLPAQVEAELAGQLRGRG
jgi:DNA-binding MarR family transcriptional regulator